MAKRHSNTAYRYAWKNIKADRQNGRSTRQSENRLMYQCALTTIHGWRCGIPMPALRQCLVTFGVIVVGWTWASVGPDDPLQILPKGGA